MNIKDLKDSIEELPDDMLIMIVSGNSFYEVTDINNTSLGLEIQSGEHLDFN